MQKNGNIFYHWRDLINWKLKRMEPVERGELETEIVEQQEEKKEKVSTF